MDLNHKKILITCGGGLGDMLCFTPALREMKAQYPDARIVFMTKYGNHEVLEGLPYLEKIIYIRRGKFLGRYRVLPDFVGTDAVVFTDWQPQLLLFSRLLGIPVRAGVGREGHRLERCLTRRLETNVMKSKEYAPRTNARLFSEALDICLDAGDVSRLDVAQPSLEVCAQTTTMLAEVGLRERDPYIMLSPFTGFEQRNWSLEQAKQFVTDAAKEFGMPVLVTAPAKQRAVAREISGYSLAGRTGTMHLVELVKRATLLVSPDSGPMHVAGAVSTPCVALFSKDLPSRWAPRRACVPIYLEKVCSPCDDDTARRCSHVSCMREISSGMVLRACRQLLGQTAGK